MEKYDYSGAEGNTKYDLSRDFTRINDSQNWSWSLENIRMNLVLN